MAFVGAPSSSQTIKEGYLTTEKKSSILRKKTVEKKYWWVLTREQDTVLACYKDETKAKLKEKMQLALSEEVEIDKQKHDNYISITRGKQVTFLRAENTQQRDEWYAAIANSLRQLGCAGDDDTAAGSNPMRDRSNTDNSDVRPPVRRGRGRHGPQTTQGIYPTFKKQLDHIATRPLPEPVPDDIEDDISKIKTNYYCCIRNHVQSWNAQGINMADTETVYENIHFVRSQDEWIAGVEQRRRNNIDSAVLYRDFGVIVSAQQPPNEPIYESRLPSVAEEEDKREWRPHEPNDAHNNLNSDSPHEHPVPFNPNIAPHNISPTNSIVSNEDNTERTPPPLPPYTDEQLEKKTRQLKEEQKHVHGIPKTFSKSSVVGDKIRFMEMKDGIWVIGWDESKPELRGTLKVGDQLIKINSQVLTSVDFARDTIKSTDDHQVTMVLKRIPHGTVCTIRRSSKYDDLGIRVEGNEIVYVDPLGLASSRGDLKPETTGVTGRMCNWAVTEINARPVDLFASSDDIMKILRQAGKEVTLLLQPVDFIQKMRDNLKTYE